MWHVRGEVVPAKASLCYQTVVSLLASSIPNSILMLANIRTLFIVEHQTIPKNVGNFFEFLIKDWFVHIPYLTW